MKMEEIWRRGAVRPWCPHRSANWHGKGCQSSREPSYIFAKISEKLAPVKKYHLPFRISFLYRCCSIKGVRRAAIIIVICSHWQQFPVINTRQTGIVLWGRVVSLGAALLHNWFPAAGLVLRWLRRLLLHRFDQCPISLLWSHAHTTPCLYHWSDHLCSPWIILANPMSVWVLRNITTHGDLSCDPTMLRIVCLQLTCCYYFLW